MGRDALFVAIGGVVGCVARFLIVSIIAETFPASIPYGTLLVNIAGSLVIGASVGFSDRFHWVQYEWRILLTAGFCGGFTTFSAFALENAQMLIEQSYWTFSVYSLLSFSLCIAAVFGGMQLAKL